MKVLVLIADGKTPDSFGDIFDINALELTDIAIPVTIGFSNKFDDYIGIAKLSIEDDKVYAEINYIDNEKAKLKQQIPMYPAINGYVLDRKWSDFGYYESKITKFRIKSIAFNHEKNADERIPKV